MMRAWVGVLLAGSGVLMVAASSQRWGGVCSLASAVGGELTDACALRTDHDFEFLPPVDPWLPVGSSAQLAGWSLVVLAVALVLLPWALTGRRPGHVTAVALAAAGLAALAMGVATIRSGASGVVVAPVLGAVTLQVWLLLPPAVLVVLAVGARGWARASAILLVLASPLVAALLLRTGPLGCPAVVGGHVGDAGGRSGAESARRRGQTAPGWGGHPGRVNRAVLRLTSQA